MGNAETSVTNTPTVMVQDAAVIKPALLSPGFEAKESANDWTTLSTEPRTPIVEADMAEYIKHLAERDPQLAITTAAQCANIRLRAALFRAALQGWGKSNPAAAATWVDTETIMDKEQAVSALLTSAVENPDEAINATTALIQNNPEQATQFGTDLIRAFTESGQFTQAADFAANGPASNRDDWIMAAFSRWAEFQPQSAIATAMQMQNPELQQSALDAIIVGWSPTDPQGMAQFAANNLSGQQQSAALSRALGFWADSDPVATANWINQNSPGPAADTSIAEIASSPALSQSPAAAAAWAASIINPDLRSQTLNDVLGKWATTDLSGAENFVQTSPAITEADRPRFFAQLQQQFAQP